MIDKSTLAEALALMVEMGYIALSDKGRAPAYILRSMTLTPPVLDNTPALR